MKIINIGEKNSIFNHFIREIRDVNIQNDPMRFRRNIERIGEIFAYEISKTMTFRKKDIVTPLGISTEKTELVLFGHILKSDELYQLLFDYVRHISFGKRPNNLQYANELDKIKPNEVYPRFVDFGKDVVFDDFSENLHFYYVEPHVFVKRVKKLNSSDVPLSTH